MAVRVIVVLAEKFVSVYVYDYTLYYANGNAIVM